MRDMSKIRREPMKKEFAMLRWDHLPHFLSRYKAGVAEQLRLPIKD